MFSDDLFSSVFSPSFFPSSILSAAQPSFSLARRINNSNERNSHHRTDDFFTNFSRAADEFFNAATRSFFRDTDMFPRHFYPSYLRDISHLPSNNRRYGGVTLNGVPVGGNDSTARQHRHGNEDPVSYERSRLQWYDSNTRRPLLPPPAPARSEPSGFISAIEITKLPISIYKIKKKNTSNCSDVNSPNTSSTDDSVDLSSPETHYVPVLNGNSSNIQASPGSAYLQPEPRTSTVVPIQPIQSSPARGHPECEVCLTEYRNNDRLRHLPCGHAFHVKCIDVWLKQSTTCPKCRAGVRSGLKRLERAHSREKKQSSRDGNNSRIAPVHAIRHYSNRPSTSNNEQISPPNSLHTSSTSRTQIANRSTISGSVGNLVETHSNKASRLRTASNTQRRISEVSVQQNCTRRNNDKNTKASSNPSTSTSNCLVPPKTKAGCSNQNLSPEDSKVETCDILENQGVIQREYSETCKMESKSNDSSKHNSTAYQNIQKSSDKASKQQASSARQKAVEAAMRRAIEAKLKREQDSEVSTNHPTDSHNKQ